MNIRFATMRDADALLDIYGQYMDTPITFECRLPTRQEFAQRIAEISVFYPYLVCEENGKIVGYAYAHRQHAREAYQWNAELSVYLDEQAAGRGLGQRLYRALMELLLLQGIKTVYGCVTHPNVRSEHLHARMGFRCLGTYHNTGYKCGKWHDVCWFEKELAPYDGKPEPVRSVLDIPEAQLTECLRQR